MGYRKIRIVSHVSFCAILSFTAAFILIRVSGWKRIYIKQVGFVDSGTQDYQMNHHFPRGSVPKHTAVLEEIHEERDSLPDEDNILDSSNSQRKNAVAGDESPTFFPQDHAKLEDPLSFVDDEDDRPRRRSFSVGNADLEEKNRDNMSDTEKSQLSNHRYTRHSSIDRGNSNGFFKTGSPEEAVEKYYERNNYTVTGLVVLYVCALLSN
uniref:Transmembrane protein n=1 Tax=Caenorhabditis tropicalis TaxID=1561998 RepID=A0A1I7V328_9PELO